MKSKNSSNGIELSKKEMLKLFWATKDVYGLCRVYFGVKLTSLQEKIVRCVGFDEHNRVVISCMTRYGKSYSVALGILLWIVSNKNKRIVIIAPTNEKTSIIRNYLSHFVTMSAFFMSQLDIDKSGAERIRKEVSRTRMTWKNGVEMRTLSAEGQGNALMGFGADKVICFPKNTLISSKKGLKRIQNIKQNDLVLSFNNGFQYKKVKRVFKNKSPKKLIKIITSEGNIICTENHPFYTNNGIKHASSLCVLDKIYKYIDTSKKDANNKMSYVPNPLLQETEPYKKNKFKLLQQYMQSKILFRKKQLFLSKWESKNNLSSMQKTLLCGQRQKRKGKVLFKKMLLPILQRPPSYYNKDLSILWTGVQSNKLYKKTGILFKEMCKLFSCNKNEEREQSNVEGGNKKRSLFGRFQFRTKIKDKKKRKLPMFCLQKKQTFIRSSHKLQQNRQPRREPHSSLYILPFQNKPQQGILAEVTITSIKRISTKEEIVYNLEVEHNHNYFANGFLVHNCDEECDIDYEVYRSKITRMLGDHPEQSTYIGIGNPWKRTNQMYQHWIDPNWYKIHIGWKDALQEGRITQAFVDEQRSILTDYEFKVLYDAEFPDEDIDSLIKWEWIVKAQREIPDDLPKSL